MIDKYYLTKLKNGLRILSVPMESTPSVTVMLIVKVGSRWENDRQAGISHFFEHMPFKGTKKYPSALLLSSAIDAVGADFNAFTDKEYTVFFVRVASRQLRLALGVLSQMVLYPLLRPEDIEKEKGVIVEEINMRNDHPMEKIGEEFEILLYGLTRLGRPVIGSRKTVTSLTQQDFTAFCQNWYRPTNMILGVVGGVKKREIDIVKRFFSQDFGKQDMLNHRNGFQMQSERTRVIYKKTEQSHFCLGVTTFERGHQDRYALSLLTTILGGNMSSRLFIQVRERRGLAYYVRTSPASFLDTGYLVTQAGTDINKTKEAIKVIQDEYFKMGTKKFGATTIELNKAKEYIKGKMALGLESSKAVAMLFLDDLLMEGKIRTPKSIGEAIDKVTVADIKRVARSIFKPEALRLAVIGPFKKDSFSI